MRTGFSTACLYYADKKFIEKVQFYKALNTNAMELDLGPDFQLSDQLSNEIKKFEFISIHAPYNPEKYGSNSTTKQFLKKLKDLTKRLPVKGIVFHPDNISNLSVLEKSNLPILIENMDVEKKINTDVKYFEDLIRDYDFKFVLDIQHAYEYDDSMEFARDLVSTMGERLNHIHISGQTKDWRHNLIHISDNKQKITEFLKSEKLKVPKILEGILLGDSGQILSNARKELDYIGSL